MAHLVREPPIARGMARRSSGIDELRRERLRLPPVDRRVIDLDATCGELFLDVAVGQSVASYQRTATAMTSGGKR
jgi:hypothetical protein